MASPILVSILVASLLLGQVAHPSVEAFSKRVRELWHQEAYADLHEYVRTTYNTRQDWIPAITAEVFVESAYEGKCASPLQLLYTMQNAMCASKDNKDRAFCDGLKSAIGVFEAYRDASKELGLPTEGDAALLTQETRVRDLRSVGEDNPLLALLDAAPDKCLHDFDVPQREEIPPVDLLPSPACSDDTHPQIATHSKPQFVLMRLRYVSAIAGGTIVAAIMFGITWMLIRKHQKPNRRG